LFRELRNLLAKSVFEVECLIPIGSLRIAISSFRLKSKTVVYTREYGLMIELSYSGVYRLVLYLLE